MLNPIARGRLAPTRNRHLSQRQSECEDLGNALDREQILGVTTRDEIAINCGHGNAELLCIDPGEFGDVIRNAPLTKAQRGLLSY